MSIPFYTHRAEWWPLLSAPEEYEEEAAAYAAIMRSACVKPPRTVLELGSGGGNNASFLKRHISMTLTDMSPAMLDVSRKLNPECRHLQGDMRSLRLGEVFDAVFTHDAISYMTTRTDLRRAMKTAFIHCRPGGAALFIPDYTRETFREATSHGGHNGPGRSLRYLQWDHDPHPRDTRYDVELVFMFHQKGQPITVEHETHHCGLFSVASWYEDLRRTGFRPDSVTLESDELEAGMYRVFIGRKP